MRDKVYGELVGVNRWISTRELATTMHYSESYIRDVLRVLLAQGCVEQRQTSRRGAVGMKQWRAGKRPPAPRRRPRYLRLTASQLVQVEQALRDREEALIRLPYAANRSAAVTSCHNARMAVLDAMGVEAPVIQAAA